MCGGNLPGFGGGFPERLGKSGIDLGGSGDDEADPTWDLPDDRVESLGVGRIGHRHERGSTLRTEGNRAVPARAALREEVDGGLIEVELPQIDELEPLLLGHDPRKISLADEALLEEHVPQAAACGPRRRQRRVELIGCDEARSRDQLAERQVAFVIRRRCH